MLFYMILIQKTFSFPSGEACFGYKALPQLWHDGKTVQFCFARGQLSNTIIKSNQVQCGSSQSHAVHMNQANDTQNNHGLVPAPLVLVSVFMMVGSKEGGGG